MRVDIPHFPISRPISRYDAFRFSFNEIRITWVRDMGTSYCLKQTDQVALTHCLFGPARTTRLSKEIFFIRGSKFSEYEWKHNIMVTLEI